MDSPFHQDSVDVAVIGAGFSGTMAAVHLLNQTDDPITVGLVERTSEFGRGLAYRTRDLTHRLNVPAAKMGAFPEDIEGLYRWLQTRPERLRNRGRAYALSKCVCSADALRRVPRGLACAGRNGSVKKDFGRSRRSYTAAQRLFPD